MKALLDSQVLFWLMTDRRRLSPKVSPLFIDTTNEWLVSPVSHWEMALKLSVGSYEIKDDFEVMWQATLDRYKVLPIEPRHSARLIDLPFHHRDPFDRMLIAQALAEDVAIVSSDRRFDDYGVRRLW